MISAEELAKAAQIIRDGGLVAFPTETVYGLGANALDAVAVRRIFELKGRPSTSPLIVHVDSVQMARSLVTEWSPLAESLASEHWPGPLTLVLPKRREIPDEVTAGLSTVGIRVPAHPVALALIRAAGVPIAAPSANRFTELSPTTAAHVCKAFGDSILILDGGATTVGIESTVVSLAGPKPLLLRPGTLPMEELARVSAAPGEAHPAPGMHERHYSPRTRVRLVDARHIPAGKGVYVWWNSPGNASKAVNMPADPSGYAARLYQVLHALDAEGWDWIAVENVPSGPGWDGIRDRLERAAR